MSTVAETSKPPVVLSWIRRDPEQWLFFQGGRFTRVNTWCALLLGALATTAFYLALLPFSGSWLAATFMDRGVIPYCIVGFFFWSLGVLGLKYLKLRLQRRALEVEIVPHQPDFVLTPKTVLEVLDRMHLAVDDPRQFVLFNRIQIALSNLRNLGRVSDVDEILNSQADQDASVVETSYALVQGFVWAIPVLGFIGTVQGLSLALGGFGSVLASTSELVEVKDALRGVTGGLSIAFETTLQGLVAALVVQLALTALKKSEEEFLDSCSEYCVRHIVGKLRLMPFEQEETA